MFISVVLAENPTYEGPRMPGRRSAPAPPTTRARRAAAAPFWVKRAILSIGPIDRICVRLAGAFQRPQPR